MIGMGMSCCYQLNLLYPRDGGFDCCRLRDWPSAALVLHGHCWPSHAPNADSSSPTSAPQRIQVPMSFAAGLLVQRLCRCPCPGRSDADVCCLCLEPSLIQRVANGHASHEERLCSKD